MDKRIHTVAAEESHSIRDFLNPKAALTPGIAGGLTMLITNTLYTQFSLPPRFVGLGVSFLFGLVVLFAGRRMKPWHCAIYLVLNTLVIFSIAAGTSGVAAPPRSVDVEFIQRPGRADVISTNALPSTNIASVARTNLLVVVRPVEQKTFFNNWFRKPDHWPGDSETTIDGVGFKLVPEPSPITLLAVGALIMLAATSRRVRPSGTAKPTTDTSSERAP